MKLIVLRVGGAKKEVILKKTVAKYGKGEGRGYSRAYEGAKSRAEFQHLPITAYAADETTLTQMRCCVPDLNLYAPSIGHTICPVPIGNKWSPWNIF